MANDINRRQTFCIINLAIECSPEGPEITESPLLDLVKL